LGIPDANDELKAAAQEYRDLQAKNAPKEELDKAKAKFLAIKNAQTAAASAKKQ
jgi:hypothetical protein